MRFFIWLLVSTSLSVIASPNNFSQAKKIAEQLFEQNPQTIYCQCLYDKKEVQLDSCNMQSAGTVKRAHRIEWEHIMAAQHFGVGFDCWNKPLCERDGTYYKGRACCEKIDPKFRQVESELYNLWPEVGAVNLARSNYRFVASLDIDGFYGCAIKINKKQHQVEPPDYAKGTVARAYLFMAYFYSISLKEGEYELFIDWNRRYPPTPWELTWANQVAEIEGYTNPFIMVG